MSLTRGLHLRPDHENYPLCVFQRSVTEQTGKQPGQSKNEVVLLLETFGPQYGREKQPERYAALTGFVVSIAEPISRPKHIHMYVITEQSLRSAGQLGFSPKQIKEELLKYSKYEKLPDLLEKWLENIEKSNKQISIQLYDCNYYLVRMPRELDQRIKAKFREKKIQKKDMNDDEVITEEDLFFYQPDEPLQDNFFSRLTPSGGSYKRSLIYIDKISAFRQRIWEMRSEVELIEECFIEDVDGETSNDQAFNMVGMINKANTKVSGAIKHEMKENAGQNIQHTNEYRALLDENVVRMYLDGELLEIQERQRYWRLKDQELGRVLAAEEDDFAFDKLVRDQLGDCSKGIQAAFRLSRLFKKKAPALQADLRSTTQLRAYQAHSVLKIVSQHEFRQHGNKVKVKKLNSGMIVLPCGSGKSLQGIATACKVGHSCIIVTNSNLSNLQWASQFRQFTTIHERRIFIFSSGEQVNVGAQKTRRLFIPGFHTVLIATYQMLTQATSSYARTINQLIRCVTWGTVLFDEAHQMFARTFRGLFMFDRPFGVETSEKAMKNEQNKRSGLPDVFLRSYCKVGLTATPLREDNRIGSDLHYLGRRLFECSWGDLASQGYLASLSCIEVNCEMSRGAYSRYWAAERGEMSTTSYLSSNWLQAMSRIGSMASEGENAFSVERIQETLEIHQDSDLRGQLERQLLTSAVLPHTLSAFPIEKVRSLHQNSNQMSVDVQNRLKKLLPVLNERKLLITSLLINYHISQGHQILIFCDSIIGAEIYSKILNIPFVAGGVEEVEREAIVEAFLERKCQCILLTRVGDTSLDLPDANVLIEVNWQEKSQRQETQRIGRISRPKSSGYEGFFYILVSEATAEVHTARERRQYLTQKQGYSFCQVNGTEIEQICKAQGVRPHKAVHEIVKNEQAADAYLNEVVTTIKLKPL